jgi:hypothetical protein
MAGVDDWKTSEEQRAAAPHLEPHQVDAAAAPRLPIRKLAGVESSSKPGGNFKDLDHLIEQLGSPPVFELGKPQPEDRYIPRNRAGSCPAAHNKALLGDE